LGTKAVNGFRPVLKRRPMRKRSPKVGLVGELIGASKGVKSNWRSGRENALKQTAVRPDRGGQKGFPAVEKGAKRKTVT